MCVRCHRNTHIIYATDWGLICDSCEEERRKMLFEFKCIECGSITEEICSVDSYSIICKRCGGDAVKVISLPADRNYSWQKECSTGGKNV